MAKTNYMIRESGIQGIMVESWTYQNGTRLCARLIGIDRKPIDNYSKIKRTVHHSNEIARLREAVGVELVGRWKKANGNNNDLHSDLASGSSLCDLYDNVANKRELNAGAWGERTEHDNHYYFRHKFLPAIDEMLARDGEINEANMAEVANRLLEASFRNGKSFKEPSSESRFLDKLKNMNSMLVKLFAAQHLDKSMLPQVPIKAHAKITQHEQQKWLSQEMRDAIAILLLSKGSTEAEALVCAIMFCAGLRTSEAAAVFFGDIHVSKDGRFAVLYVETQLDDHGKINPLLKSDNAYRMVVLPFFFIELYNRRISELLRNGLSYAEIMKMPIWDANGKNSSAISAYGKELIRAAGMDNFEGVEEAMKRTPDIVDGKPVNDLCAYILRRDWATRAVACGLSEEDLDYYLGHENEKVKPGKYLTSNKQREIAYKLEDYSYHRDSSMHPGVNPVALSNEKRVKLDSRVAFKIRNDGNTPLRIELRLQCREPGDCIQIRSPRKLSNRKKNRCEDDLEADRIGRRIPMKQRKT